MQLLTLYISQMDILMYGFALTLSAAIVLVNNLPPQTAPASPTDQYMSKILTRMDSVSAHMLRWEAFDVGHHNGY